METTAPNRLFYLLAGTLYGQDYDIVLVGTECSCGVEHKGALTGCFGNPAFGCLWGAAPRSDNRGAYGNEIALEPLTVWDAIRAVGPDGALAVLEASVAACRLMANEILLLDDEHHHEAADELRETAAFLRRQLSIAALKVDQQPGRPVELPDTLWRHIVELDAALASDREVTFDGVSLCGHDHGDENHHHDELAQRRHSHRTQARNAPCACGSGKKFKHCHGQ